VACDRDSRRADRRHALVGSHANLIDQISTPQNLVLLWFLFPIIKALHEFATPLPSRRSREVHEMGIMLLVFSPVPMSTPRLHRPSPVSGRGQSSARQA